MVKNVLILTYWNFEDALIQAYTLPYVKLIKKELLANSKIYLVTFQNNTNASEDEKLQFEKEKIALAQSGIYILEFKYYQFGILAFFRVLSVILFLTYFIIKNNIKIIHTWCMTAGSLGYVLSVLTNRELIADSYEPHAEPMVDGGTWKTSDVAFKLLNYFERKIGQRAKYVIGLTAGMKTYAKERYKIELKNYFIKPACVDFSIFNFYDVKDENLLNELQLKDKIICVCAGKLGGLYLEQEVFDFYKVANNYWGDKFRVLFLSATSEQQIANYCIKSNLERNIIVSRFVPHSEISRYLKLADFAINPSRSLKGREHGSPIKDGEYWAMGLPVVITKGISDDSEIIERENIGVVIESLDNETYLKAIKKIDTLLLTEPPEVIGTRIRNVAIKYRSFEIAEKVYRTIYSN